MIAQDLGYDIFDSRFVSDPHPVYARMRREAPIIWSEQHDGWIVTRFDDVREVLRRSATFSNAARVEQPDSPATGTASAGQHRELVVPRTTQTMVSTDGSEHRRLRHMLDQDFAPRRLAELEPHLQEATERYLAGACERGDYDVINELAVPLPVTVIAELLGIPLERRDDLKRWSEASGLPFTPESSVEEIQGRNEAVIEFRDFLTSEIARREDAPTADLIGRLAANHVGGALTGDELLATIQLLLVGGNVTTTNLIGNVVLALLRHPEQLRSLRADPSLLDSMVEEVLRYDSSVQFVSRMVIEDTELGGHAFKPGEMVYAVIASANRDEAVWPHPDEFQIARTGAKHLAFGVGAHVCVGQYLARAETRAAVRGLLAEFPRIEAITQLGKVPYKRHFNLRGVLHLRVRNAVGR